ncbi:serine hydrolase domain-containing protein, partial [Novosphingobium sp. PhB57]|uniref:serine hydrolase domain-containing protein n=1 Tax=Novosphingobium sp. PhB57 TaxID=2485107 RepID=UPI0010513546
MASFDLPILGAPMSRRTMLAASIFGAAAPALAKADDDPLERFLKKQLEGAAIPGMAIGVARAGKVTLMRGYGFADIAQHRQVTTDTMFHLASVTKTVTATAIMMLVEAGHIDLDAPISGYLDFKVINPAHPDSAITVRHLLTHVSSL